MQLVFVRVNWNNTAFPGFGMPGTRWFDLHLVPEPGYPYGRKGLALEGAWRQLGGAGKCGMLVLDGDVAIDPLDYAAMGEAIALEPEVIHVGPIRLWPASTMKESWTWGHWCGDERGQDYCPEPDRWTFGFTYLPARLLELARAAGMRRWTFPDVDTRMAAVARQNSLVARPVAGCHPKHLHY